MSMPSSSLHRPKKHSISSLLNSPVPDEDARGPAQIDSRLKGHTEPAYRLQVAEWTRADSSAAQPLDGVAVWPDRHPSSPFAPLSDIPPPPLHVNASLRSHPSSTISAMQERGFQPPLDSRGRPPPISQKRGVSDVHAPEDRPNARRRVTGREAVLPTALDERSKARIKATERMPLNNGSPGTMYTIVPKDDRTHRDGAPYQVTPATFPAGTTALVERQVSRCMSADYKKRHETFPHCLACASRTAGDTCRFQHIRAFLLDPEKDGRIVGFYFPDQAAISVPPPSASKNPIDGRHVREVKEVVVRALLPTLREELERVKRPGVVYLPRGGKAACDKCLGSILLSCWLCIHCGRALCSACFAQVEQLTVGTQEELEERGEAFFLRNPSFLRCFKTHASHGAADFVLVARLDRGRVETAVCEMERLLRCEPPESRPDDSDEHRAGTVSTSNFIDTSNSMQNIFGSDIPAHTIRQFTQSALTEDVFRAVWSKGEPLLVTALAHPPTMCSPQYLAGKLNTQKLNVTDCQTKESRWIAASEFFGTFGRYDHRERCWKLQAFPPPSAPGARTPGDLRYALPDLYADLVQALPMPGYVCEDAVRNIASHFTFDSNEPNLGPILEVAYANRTSAGNKGSVQFHFERGDELNIMTYAAPDPEGRAGGAAWDVFRAEDSGKIRQFLLRQLRSINPPNPLYTDQMYYLDDAARRVLLQQYGVKSYRVHQKPGDALFIPAGCAYQVCNRSDCISVTTGFVSPESVRRCEALAGEVTFFNRVAAREKPVLPLRAMLWAAWLSCCRQEKPVAQR